MRFSVPYSSPEAKRRYRRIAVVFATALLLMLPGCGKKGDPVLPTAFVPQPVSGFAAQRAGEGISLSWQVPEGAGNVVRFRILRSELETGGASCPGCPREYRLIDELAPGDRLLIREGKGTYGYHDFTVRPGRLYTYRVQACYAADLCSEARESADIKFD